MIALLDTDAIFVAGDWRPPSFYDRSDRDIGLRTGFAIILVASQSPTEFAGIGREAGAEGGEPELVVVGVLGF